MIYSEINVANVEEIEKRLGNFKSKAPLVLSRAINRSIQNVRKNMGKETSQRYYVLSSDVKKTVRVVKASKGSLKAAAISSGEGIALSKFKVSPNTPVRYRGASRSPKVYRAGVKKSGGMKPLDGDPKSFVAEMKTGHIGVFTRKTGDRLPIRQLFGPSVPQIVKSEDIMSEINAEASKTLQKRIDAEINNILRKG